MLVDLGRNSLRFGGHNLNGFTPNLTGHKILVKLGGNSLYASLVELGYHPNEFNWHLSQWIYSEFDWLNFKFDWASSTSQIGWKFTENTLYASLVELGIISMDLHPI